MNRTAPTLGLCLTLTFGLLLSALSNTAYAKVLHEERSVYTRIIVEDCIRLRFLNFTLKRFESTKSCVNLNYPKRMVFSIPKCHGQPAAESRSCQRTHRWLGWWYAAYGVA